MKDEDKWRETLKKTRWMWFKVVNENNDWMSTVDKKTGYGNIDKDDFVKLLESHGFRVRSAKPIILNYKFSKVFLDNFVKHAYSDDFPELVGDERKEFFQEFNVRHKKHVEQVIF